MTFHVPNVYRVRVGKLASTSSYGNNGAFIIPSSLKDRTLCVIVSDGAGWEHVSGHAEKKMRGRIESVMPFWDEMCFLKDVFWDLEDVVMQLHPRESEYVNFYKTSLHLWRPIGKEIPTPPSILVGPRMRHV